MSTTQSAKPKLTKLSHLYLVIVIIAFQLATPLNGAPILQHHENNARAWKPETQSTLATTIHQSQQLFAQQTDALRPLLLLPVDEADDAEYDDDDNQLMSSGDNHYTANQMTAGNADDRIAENTNLASDLMSESATLTLPVNPSARRRHQMPPLRPQNNTAPGAAPTTDSATMTESGDSFHLSASSATFAATSSEPPMEKTTSPPENDATNLTAVNSQQQQQQHQHQHQRLQLQPKDQQPEGQDDDNSEDNNQTGSRDNNTSSHDYPGADVDEETAILLLRDNLTKSIFEEVYWKNLSDLFTITPAGTFGMFGDRPLEIASASGVGGPLGAVGVPGTALVGAAAAGSAPYGLNMTTSNSTLLSAASQFPRPYLGDVFYQFQSIFWPIHYVLGLVICTLGIFANVTNIIVLTRPNMVTPVNTILWAIALFDLVVNIANIPYLVHEFNDDSDATSFFSYGWAIYILFYAHTTVTAHTISIWLTCVLATWRYFVVCRSTSANQRNWTVGLAKRAIFGVILFIPIVCIPNYLTFAIVEEKTELNATIYKVGFSSLADRHSFIKTFNFSIFSCLTKLVPCVFLSFFTSALIKKLLNARQRRMRLTGYANNSIKDHDEPRNSLPNGDGAQKLSSQEDVHLEKTANGIVSSQQRQTIMSAVSHCDNLKDLANRNHPDHHNHHHMNHKQSLMAQDGHSVSGHSTRIDLSQSNLLLGGGGGVGGDQQRNRINFSNEQVSSIAPEMNTSAMGGATTCCANGSPSKFTAQQSGSSYATITEPELVGLSCDSSTSGDVQFTNTTGMTGSAATSATLAPSVSISAASSSQTPASGVNLQQQQQQQQQRVMSQLMVVETGRDTITTTTMTNQQAHQMLSGQHPSAACGDHLEVGVSTRSCNTPDPPRLYAKGNGKAAGHSSPKMMQSKVASSHDLTRFNISKNNEFERHNGGRKSLASGVASAMNLTGHDNGLASINKLAEKRCSETTLAIGARGRSVGSTTIAPFQMVKLQATQRQLSQNETTTRLLIAVMIVFLICEFPAGILAALCAILGVDFFENVYQPTGALTDLLALINSSVNFILYCFMSTQFRVTFYRVVLHCPAPNAPQ